MPCSASITCLEACSKPSAERMFSDCRYDEPRFEVMMMTVFLKSTLRPLPSVSGRRP